jgi:hypothetical protein
MTQMEKLEAAQRTRGKLPKEEEDTIEEEAEASGCCTTTTCCQETFRLHKQQLKCLYKSSFCSTKKKFGF